MTFLQIMFVLLSSIVPVVAAGAEVAATLDARNNSDPVTLFVDRGDCPVGTKSANWHVQSSKTDVAGCWAAYDGRVWMKWADGDLMAAPFKAFIWTPGHNPATI